MPIYAYKCSSCGHQKDVLQKMSDDPLSLCPACGAASFAKQLTAAGFQLKGSGWYATDFKGGPVSAPPTEAKTDATPSEAGKKTEGAATTPAAAPVAAAASKSESVSPAPSSAPSAGQ